MKKLNEIFSKRYENIWMIILASASFQLELYFLCVVFFKFPRLLFYEDLNIQMCYDLSEYCTKRESFT